MNETKERRQMKFRKEDNEIQEKGKWNKRKNKRKENSKLVNAKKKNIRKKRKK
jgi:hypothetical protein